MSTQDEESTSPPRHPWRGWIAGGIAFAVNFLAACIWAFWGTCEAFHEGWLSPTLLGNLGMTAVYLLPCFVFVVFGIGVILRPRIFSVVYGVLGCGVFVWWMYECWPPRPFFFTNILTEAAYALVAVGVLSWFGALPWKKWAVLLLICAPLVICVVCAVEPVSRLMTRVDDGILDARTIAGNGVTLAWAPRGPGWPEKGCTWYQAADACRHLSADGLRLEAEPVDIWRLPTIDEAVRSMTRAGENAGGVWDSATMQPVYARRPDKESPLWVPTSRIIYLWTATEGVEDRAYFIAANGYVRARPKDLGMGSQSFRAVKRGEE